MSHSRSQQHKGASVGHRTPLLPSQESTKFVAYSDDLESFSIHQSPMVRLYDIDSSFEIPLDVADGYLILLSGGLNSAQAIRQQRKKKKVSSAPPPGGNSNAHLSTSLSPEELAAVQLAFYALTAGNAIDAVFGVKSMGGLRRREHTSQIAFDAANEAKQSIVSAAATSDAIRLLAVETYVKFFEIIVKHNLDSEKTGVFSRCFIYPKLRVETVKQIEDLFHKLEEGVASSS